MSESTLEVILFFIQSFLADNGGPLFKYTRQWKERKVTQTNVISRKVYISVISGTTLTTDKEIYIESLCTGRNKQKNISNLKRKQLLQGINKMIENSLETKRGT